MIKTLTWNTGALYTAEGQVITAQFDFTTRRVIFKDHSRCIDGVFTDDLSRFITTANCDYDLKEWVMHRYLRNTYTYDTTGNSNKLKRT